MVDPHVHGCPEPEVLAAYVDRGLSLSERARVDAHLASCPQCIALVAGVARTVAELSALVPDAVVAAGASPLVTRRAVAGVVAAAAAVIAIVAAPSLVRPWLDRDAGLVNLVGTVGEQRSVLGRLTGGFPHAPLGAPPAGGQGGRTAGADRVQLTADRVRESFGERATPAQLHALGVAHLLAGRYDDAAQSLLAASREQPANARYLNDVATAQLERARLGLRPDDLPRALAAADRARRLDPALKEAWFNRALAASALSLRDQAKDAWTQYLKLDSASRWAGEATSRLQELSNPTPAQAWTTFETRLQEPFDSATAEQAVSAHMTEARRIIENRFLPAWADAVAAGRDGTTELERARLMAAAMLRVGGDALYLDTVNVIDLASRQGRGAELARAHQLYRDAAAVYANDQYPSALPLLRDARAALMAAGSPYAIRPTIDVASIVYVTGGYAENERLLSEALSTAQSRQYAFAEGRANWISGLAGFAQGRLADARTSYESTLATFTRMGDQEQIAAAHTLLAGLFYYLGDENQAWTHFVPSLKGLGITRSLKLRHGLLSAAATSIRESNPEAALAIQNETVRNAQQRNYDVAIAESRMLRASILAALGRADEAEADLAEAQRHLARVDPAIQSRLQITALLTQSKLLRTTNPAAAVAAAERAIALVEQRRDRFPLPQLHLELAKANIVWGNRSAAAELALQRGIRAFDVERSTIKDEGRVSTRDDAWQLFETALQIALQKKDFDRAFELAERSRARSLAEARKMSAPRSLQAVQAALRSDEAIIALNQFEDQLAVWLIRSDRYEVITRKMTRAAAERLVARQHDEIWQQSAAASAGKALYNEIIRPIQARLSKLQRVVIIPDLTYDTVSFASLVESNSGRFLVEQYSVAVAPSATAFASVRERAAIQAVAGPLVFGGANAGAVLQARKVAAAYEASDLVAGGSATRSRLFAAGPSRSLVHIVAPVSVSRSNPLLSRALVADEPGAPHSGMILGRDIAASGFATNLVVLDEIDADDTNRGEGTLNLGRAFMAAGVRAVVGTLPGADEDATRDLMIGFHREMSAGISAEQALNRVQRNAIQQNGRRLGAWSALVMYGSDR